MPGNYFVQAGPAVIINFVIRTHKVMEIAPLATRFEISDSYPGFTGIEKAEGIP